jgi:hypothetical protein
MKAAAMAALLVAACAPGDASLKITVTSRATVDGVDHFQVHVGNHSETAHTLEFALVGAPVTLPPPRSFSLVFAATHHGPFDIDVGASDKLGTIFATGCVNRDVEPSRAVEGELMLGYRTGCDPAGWSVFPAATMFDLHGIWGSAVDDVWASADGGTLLHWDGSGAWSKVATASSAVLRGIWGRAHDDIWAVGDAGTVIHWDGRAWAVQPSGTTAQLEAVWGNSVGDVWIAGTKGTLLRRGPIGFAAVAGLTTHDLFGLGGAGTDTWAVGAGGTILQWDGKMWRDESIGGSQDVVGVWASDSTHVFAVGGTGTIVFWNGTRWTAQANPAGNFYGVFGRSSSDVWAVGAGGVLVHYDGNAWSGVATNTTNDLNALWGSAGGDVWAVGATGIILRH